MAGAQAAGHPRFGDRLGRWRIQPRRGGRVRQGAQGAWLRLHRRHHGRARSSSADSAGTRLSGTVRCTGPPGGGYCNDVGRSDRYTPAGRGDRRVWRGRFRGHRPGRALRPPLGMACGRGARGHDRIRTQVPDGSAGASAGAVSQSPRPSLRSRVTTRKQDIRTPVTLLTGFLGSGKTTLLNRALRDPTMANTAVVINEFGEVGLDHLLAAQSDDTIMVLENGCLCCTVFGDLVTTLNNLYHSREDGTIPRFDHVVIETSGLADPSPLIQAFLSDPTLAGLYRIASVVATVDAVNGPGTLDQHAESVRQVALADHILITKLDLVDG